MEKVEKTKALMAIFVIGIGIILSIFMLRAESKYIITLQYSVLLCIIILLNIIIKWEKNVVTPMLLFNCIYLTTSFSIWYFCYTDFETNNFAFGTIYTSDFYDLLEKSALYFLIGYIFLVIGYEVMPKKQDVINVKFESKEIITDTALTIFIIGCYVIGLFNFCFNVFTNTGGNLLLYFSNMAIVNEMYADGGTTIGYNFLYLGAYMILLKSLRSTGRVGLFSAFLILISILVKISSGRVFGTLSYIMILAGIYYFSKINSTRNINKKLIVFAGLILLGGLFMYLFRYVSSLHSAGIVYGSWIDYISESFGNILYFLFDRGNTVNVAIMPKIIDSWFSDVGPLLGKSIILSVFSIIPSSILGVAADNYYWKIKELWFSDVSGGGLPPTIIGEMYMNFGIVGITLGMLCFGLCMKYVYNWYLAKQGYFRLLVFLNMCFGFFLLIPKTATGNLPVLNIALIGCMYLALRALSILDLWCRGK